MLHTRSVAMITIIINNFHHIPSSCIVNGTYGKRSSVHAQSMRVHACYASITEMNSTDRLSTSIAETKTTDRCFSYRTRQYSTCTVQIGMVRSTCMRAIYSASYLYLYTGLRKPKERVKFDQPYLSEKVTRSF